MKITFGTDGWRGVIGDDFTFENVRYVAQGIAEYITSKGGSSVVVGYDFRFGSEVFAEQVARVLAGNSVRVLQLDAASPTQVASWTIIAEQAAGAVMVTASHNPYLFNGIKYRPETASSAPPEVLRELEQRIDRIVEGGGQVRQSPARDPLIATHNPRPSYFAQIGKMVDLPALRSSGLRILHECMYGSGVGYLRQLLEGGQAEVVELHSERNPFFGGVHPEPLPQNMPETLARMTAGGYDLAVCTDGDADRVGIIDEQGGFINQLEVYALLVRYLVEMRGWRGPLVRSLNMTSMADILGERYGLPVYEVPVGFKNIAPKMAETDALLGGEESGGYAIRGHINERDGLLVGLFFADMLRLSGKPLSQLRSELFELVGPHAYHRHDFSLPREGYEAARQRILGTLRENPLREIAGVAVAQIRSEDGFKYILADGSWVVLRTSGTEPLIRVYSEAASRAEVEARLQALEEAVGLSKSAHASV